MWGQQQAWNGAGAGADNWGNDEQLWNAISEAVAAIIHLEKELDSTKVEKKIRDYFNKAAKQMTFHAHRSLPELIDEYADNAFSSLFCGLGERDWLYSGQADLLLVVDAGVKANFPPQLVAQVNQAEFEQLVLASHDRAFEEQRYFPILTTAVQAAVQGPKIRKRVYNSAEQGRKEAASGMGVACGSGDPSLEKIEDFASRWIDRTICVLAEGLGGDPEGTLDMASACSFFHQMMEAGALPLALTQECGPPPPRWPIVDMAVQQAYTTYTQEWIDTKGKAAKVAAPAAAMGGPPQAWPSVFGKGKGPYAAAVAGPYAAVGKGAGMFKGAW